ncbi:substrate-binding domain-containing protein [Methyloparacoccus murrellii]
MQLNVSKGAFKTVLAVMLAGQALAARAEGGSFKVCADPNNPPLSVQDGSGYENRIAELLAAAQGLKLEYTWFPQRLGFIRNTLKAKVDEEAEAYKCDVVMGVPTGFELTATTRPYYRSTYVLVYRKGGALDALKRPEDIDHLPAETKSRLRIAMFDGAPGTTWLLNHGLIGQGIPYQTMTGDAAQNAAQILAKDFADGKIDMVIVWGPMSGYLVQQNPGQLAVLPMLSQPGLKFDFPMSMGVRRPDKARQQQLDELIEKHAGEIQGILRSYGVPLVDEHGQTLPTSP